MSSKNNDTLTYTKVGDYYVPDLVLDDQPDKEIGVYGRMRERYLKEYHPGRYSYMLLHGKLYSHLLEIDEAAQGYLNLMIARMADSVTEELKACDQMAWVNQMNTIHAQVEELIKIDLIYY